MNTIDLDSVVRSFREKTAEAVSLEQAGQQRFHVRTPFTFDDGDELGLVLKQEAGRWILSDEGHTYMYLSYRFDLKDLDSGTRAKIIGNTLGMFGVQDRQGELILPVESNQYGDALYTIAQAVLKISDISFLTRERVKSTFLDDFRAIMSSATDEPKFDWADPSDPKRRYTVDCFVPTGATPLFVYALATDDRVRDATISILHFEQQHMQFRSVGVFEDEEQVNRKVLARFSDVCGKLFSSLVGNRERIIQHVRDAQVSKS